MKKPNFFIIGAPKCGTTSLASWLGEHPNIFMPIVKEPHHFNTDSRNVLYKRKSDYEDLFSTATDEHLAIGEASVWYLHSLVAVENIETYVSNPKYIVCIRNPVEMAYSLHGQQLVNGNEHIEDFSVAWELSEKRRLGLETGRLCREPIHLDYQGACLVGEQLNRLFKLVPKERVFVVHLDEIKENPEKKYKEVLNFLGVAYDGRVDFPVFNSAKKVRSRYFLYFNKLAGLIKRKLGVKFGFGFLVMLNKMNLNKRSEIKMEESLKGKMSVFFENDQILLSRLLEKKC